MNHGATMQRAAALIQAGNIAEGATLCRQLLAAEPGQPEALHLLAMAARKSGDAAAAEALFRESLSRAPRQPAVLVNFGNFLRSQGRIAEAETLLRSAIELTPGFVPAWYNLGILLRAAGKPDDAWSCAVRVTELAPRDPTGWELLAATEQQRGNVEAAIAACRAGLRHTPDAGRLHYSLGQLLRQDCSFAEAALAYESALECGYETPELYQNRGESCFEAGDVDQALGVFTAGVARYPASPLLHRLRARLHWEAGVPGDAAAPLREAARNNPREAALWQALVELLNRLGRTDEGRAALVEAHERGCPPTPDLSLLDAIGCAQTGATDGATRRFARLADAHPWHVGIRHSFIEHLISTGDPARAEALCAELVSGDPHDQLAWAYRGTAWQLLGDRREAWLLDYARMVMPVRVPEPANYASGDVFFRDVAGVLDTLHRMQSHPIDQTLRGGTQTNGFLFRLKHPVLRQLETQIRLAVQAAIAELPDDAGHPFWGRRVTDPRCDGFRFTGSWSVRLKSQGFHTNHIHPEGWISSALYIALPTEIQDGTDCAGHLQFGVPPVETGLALPPRRTVKPRVGELVLFPSYMWHGTVPFVSQQPRTTVAFDLVPSD
jgi:Tfp pilus assembly protein PilF